MSSQNQKIFFHVDMDAFFASIEQRDHPEYLGKPVIVGAKPGYRGVVSAASYEAREFGVHSALPINQAYRRCPNGIFVRGRMEVYTKVSSELMAIMRSFSPLVEPLSIDEAFMDMSGTQKLWGKPVDAARILQTKIQDILNLTGSIGIAPNKFLAKIASDMNKPNGITVVPFDKNEIISWLGVLKISKIWGIGKKTEELLKSWGINLVSDLHNISPKILEKHFGKNGIALYNLSRGIDFREISELEAAKSISREYTFNKDSFDKEEWFRVILTLSRDVARRTRKSNRKGRTVMLVYRTPDFKRYSRRVTIPDPTDLAKEIYETASILLNRELTGLKSLRLIGVGISNFNEPIQINLFENSKEQKNWQASEQAMDKISDKFGKDAILRAGEMIGKNNTIQPH